MKKKLILFICSLFAIGLSSCGHTHTTEETTWHVSSSSHWHICDDCGQAYDLEEHSIGDTYYYNDTGHCFACSVCGHKAGELIEHSFGEPEITKEPTCTTEGVKTYRCVCGYEKIETIPTLEHEYSEEWKTNSAYHWHECSKCGEKVGRTTHTYGEYTVTKQPTCTETGTKERVCQECGYKQTKTIDALGHTYEEGSYECSVCHIMMYDACIQTYKSLLSARMSNFKTLIPDDIFYDTTMYEYVDLYYKSIDNMAQYYIYQGIFYMYRSDETYDDILEYLKQTLLDAGYKACVCAGLFADSDGNQIDIEGYFSKSTTELLCVDTFEFTSSDESLEEESGFTACGIEFLTIPSAYQSYINYK